MEVCCVLFERAASYLRCGESPYSAVRCDYIEVQSKGDYVKAVFGDGSYCLPR